MKKQLMPGRFFNHLRTTVLAGTAIALALLGTLNSCQSQPQEGQTIQITPAHTQAQRHTATQAAQVAHTRTPVPETAILRQAQDKALAPQTAGPTPKPPSPTLTPSSASTLTTTLKPTERPTPAVLNGSLRIQQEIVADVDLNCDGLEERVLTSELYSGNPAAGNLKHDGPVGLALQVPAQRGYDQVWEYNCELGRYGYPTCSYATVELLATDNCEQFIVFNGVFQQGGGQWRVLLFRWDGKDVSLVLDALGSEFETMQDPFGVTIIAQDCASRTQCRETRTNYLWNGTEFVRE